MVDRERVNEKGKLEENCQIHFLSIKKAVKNNGFVITEKFQQTKCHF